MAAIRRTGLMVAGTIAVVAALFIAAGPAQASITIDLRFSSNAADTTRQLTAGDQNGTVTVQVWAKVVGAASNSAPEGIGYVWGQVQSANTGGGAFVHNAVKPMVGITSGTTKSAWGGTGSEIGALADRNGDGIQEIVGQTTGSGTSNTLVPGTFFKAVSSNTNPNGTPGTHMIGDWFAGDTIAGSPEPVDVQSVTNGTEWHVADLTVQLGDITMEAMAGRTSLSWMLPNWQKTSVFYSGWNEDWTANTNATTKGTKQAYYGASSNYTVGSEVTFIGLTPEPATIALMGLGLVGLIRRRRA